MTNTQSIRPVPVSPLSWLRSLYARMAVVLALAVWGNAFAQGAQGSTPAEFQKQLDGPANTLCKYANVLPNSKWVTLAALLMVIAGAFLLFVPVARGAGAYLAKGIGVIVVLPALLGIARGLGIAC